MAKQSTKQRARDFANVFTRNMTNLREGLDEDGQDLDKKNVALFARVLGFVLLAAGLLLFVSTLQKFGLIR